MDYVTYIRMLILLYTTGGTSGIALTQLALNGMLHYGAIGVGVGITGNDVTMSSLVTALTKPLFGPSQAAKFILNSPNRRSVVLRASQVIVVFGSSLLGFTSMNVACNTASAGMAIAFFSFMQDMEKIDKTRRILTCCMALQHGMAFNPVQNLRGGANNCSVNFITNIIDLGVDKTILTQNALEKIIEAETALRLVNGCVSAVSTVADLDNQHMLFTKSQYAYEQCSKELYNLIDRYQSIRNRFYPVQLNNRPQQVKNIISETITYKKSIFDINRSDTEALNIQPKSGSQELTLLEMLKLYHQEIISIILVGSVIIIFFKRNKQVQKFFNKIKTLYEIPIKKINSNFISRRLFLMVKCFGKIIWLQACRKPG